MKFIILFLILIYSNIVYSELVYETKFHNIEIVDEIIADAKNREINRVKEISLKNIFDKILTQENKIKINKLIDFDSQIDFLIKNINIENEFISNKLYKADIKINFHKKEIIKFFRINKINYSDIESPNFLIIVSEKDGLTYNGLNLDNSFYNIPIDINDSLFKFIIPNLSPNDRFILPYEKINNKDINALINISEKYKINDLLIIYLDNNDAKIYLDLNIFSLSSSKIYHIKKLEFNNRLNSNKKLFNFVNDWWKKNNLINNSEINEILCEIHSLNLEQLQNINYKINSLSQIKSNTTNKIMFKKNYNKITYYGNKKTLLNSFDKNYLNVSINKSNKCTIKFFC